MRSNQREAVLIDFGIAREFTPNVTKLHTANLSHCFAPIEQYQSVAKRGAYTDVYALAATLYFLLTNKLPYPAPNRVSGMLLEEPQIINSSISEHINQAILKGMELEPENRPQTIQTWLDLLKKPTIPNSKSTSSVTAPSPDYSWLTECKLSKVILVILVRVLLWNDYGSRDWLWHHAISFWDKTHGATPSISSTPSPEITPLTHRPIILASPSLKQQLKKERE
ncbi:hypothetical protein [Nostoc sp.]|uniref:hypothetical protein n=1 Tax=Nostoc sp. TaxID=1180 RepID=UPI002FFBAAC2